MIEGVLIFVGGLVVGWVANKRQKPKPYKPKEIKAVCGCGHHYAEHNEEGCHHVDMVTVDRGEPIIGRNDFYEKDVVLGYRNEKREQKRCGCKRYTGPEPLPTYFPPEITP